MRLVQSLLPRTALPAPPALGLMYPTTSCANTLLQVVEEALRQKLPIQLSFIFANVSEADIIAKVARPRARPPARLPARD